MNIETIFIENYLSGKLPLPGPLVQFTLNVYLQIYNRLETVIGRVTTFVPPESEEIAARSAELMEAHYNLPLEMFRTFLGPSMKYSMALWENGARNLEEAQEEMMADLCRKMDMRDGLNVLDIGCGFGSFAEHVLRHYPNSTVHGLTLSQTQADYMRARQAENGHPFNSDRFYLIQDDFNNAVFERPFDRIVSIGVFEHISNLSKALEKIRSFITREGLCLLHYIAYRPRPGQAEEPRQDPFIERYIFPGGRTWAFTELTKHQRHFRLERDWFLNGANYRATVKAWLASYRRHFDAIQRDSGLEYRKLKLWEFYLRGCIAVFSIRGGSYYGNAQYLLRPI